ncbi:MAG: hypothetical protein WB870_02145 [Gallionellaceae bacterium]
MTAINPGRIALQARIVVTRIGLIPGVIAISILLGAAPWIWLAMNSRDQEQQELALAQARQALSAPSASDVAAQGSVAEQNLRKFYAVLGDRSETEQSLKTLFAIAAQTGISLDQGEYQWQVEKNSSTYRYQILLPVKGSYSAIRRFCEKTLQALPFASLDELSFKRESIGEDELDANLRFALYLKDVPPGPQGTGIEK